MLGSLNVDPSNRMAGHDAQPCYIQVPCPRSAGHNNCTAVWWPIRCVHALALLSEGAAVLSSAHTRIRAVPAHAWAMYGQ